MVRGAVGRAPLVDGVASNSRQRAPIILTGAETFTLSAATPRRRAPAPTRWSASSTSAAATMIRNSSAFEPQRPRIFCTLKTLPTFLDAFRRIFGSKTRERKRNFGTLALGLGKMKSGREQCALCWTRRWRCCARRRPITGATHAAESKKAGMTPRRARARGREDHRRAARAQRGFLPAHGTRQAAAPDDAVRSVRQRQDSCAFAPPASPSTVTPRARPTLPQQPVACSTGRRPHHVHPQRGRPALREDKAQHLARHDAQLAADVVEELCE